MARHAFVSAAVAVAVSTALVTAFGPVSTAVAVDTAQETVVPATYRSSNLTASVLYTNSTAGGDGAGAQGVFHQLEGHSRAVWTRYSDGQSFDTPAPSGGSTFFNSGTGSDVLAYRYGDGHIDLWNAVDGTTSTVQVPSNQSVYGVFGTTVATNQTVTAADGTTTLVKRLLTPGADGTTNELIVGGAPEGMVLGGPVRGDADGLVFRATLDGSPRLAVVDPKTGKVEGWTSALPSGATLSIRVSPDHIVAYAGGNATTAYVYSRADVAADPVAVTLDSAASATGLAIIGDWLVHQPGGRGGVTAEPIAGGDPVTLLAASNSGLSVAPDGTAVVVGRAGADDWGVQHITTGADGRPTATLVKALPKPPYPIQGLSLDQGRLVEADESYSGGRDTFGRTVAATGTPTYGARSNYDGTDVLLGICSATDVGCSQLFGTATGRTVWLERGAGGSADSEVDLLRAYGPGNSLWEHDIPVGGQITDVSGDYVLYTTDTQQYVYKIGDSAAAKVTRTPGAAALSGDLLWTASAATPGQVSAYDLAAKKTVETLTLDTAGCAPTELQANGRYLYWNCAGKTAAVYDRTAKTSVPVPADEAKLGDGYLVTHDKAAGKLVLTTVVGGTPASRVVGDLPDTGVSQRDVRWTLDESGANAAYVDAKDQIHLVPSGVPQQPLRLLVPVTKASSVTAHEIDTTPDTLVSLLLSKPTASSGLTVRDKATGKVVYTRDGGAARGALDVGWPGTDSNGKFLTDGPYDWTLTVTPADGVGAPLSVTGTVGLLDGLPARHHHVGGSDAIGDLLTQSSSGTLAFHQGTGKGTFTGNIPSTGWPASVKPLPFGDLSGDRCNDILMRPASGALRLYKPGCSAEFKTSTPYTTLGSSGWNQYDVLTYPGDVTGDGRPDLIARNSSTSTVYLYKGTSAGKLSSRVKLYANWKGYKKVVGAGDLNGDGIGDLLAQDKSNNLYRYYGTGKGTFGVRVKVFGDWGGSYNAVVGVGDITGDGRSDLVVRDSAGNLYRNSGDGKGSFAGRVKIATGWQGYKGIF